jgi:type IV pilus assembly protein PilC
LPHAAKSDLTESGTKIAEFHESEVDATVKALTSIIEPLMIVVVGGTVGGIIVAMYLLMFKIVELIE